MKRRRVGSLLALAVLAVVLERPVHPYEMASVLRARGKDQDMPIKWGSLYTVVGNLEKHGLIEVAGSERSGARPERTVPDHRCRPGGAGRLGARAARHAGAGAAKLQGRAVRARRPAAGRGDRPLRARRAALQSQVDGQRAALAETAKDVPRIFLVEDEYDLAIRTAELTWLDGLLAELADDTLPGLDLWQSWHDTGEVPAELSELAERGRNP